MTIKAGDTVKLSKEAIKQGLQGKALSDKGFVVQVVPGSMLRVKRDGIKSVKLYHSSHWESVPEATDLSDMVVAMKENQNEWDRRLIFADKLEETGDVDLAAAWRWMGRNKRRPYYREGPHLSKRWSWHVDRESLADGIDKHGPEYARLPGALMISDRGWLSEYVRFVTEDEAVEFLVKALKKLREIIS